LIKEQAKQESSNKQAAGKAKRLLTFTVVTAVRTSNLTSKICSHFGGTKGIALLQAFQVSPSRSSD
jgi:hypothetical protein